jgi:Tol biopolymer transport system component/tRNA A-37 threonylcarbamoyl transferase component Bud32
VIGKTIGHYEILERIGTGGMGEVYRARDTQLDREVAVKALPEAYTRDPERRARFEREARLLAALSHPNIAAIYDVEVSGGALLLILELVPGETVAERIERGPIPIEQALGFGLQIADALAAAHARGIIHRDLKPLNVKIRPDQRVTVLDFGLAKAFADDRPEDATVSFQTTAGSGPIGTTPYMSPEQVRGGQADTRSDIWSFGCVLYEMLTGRRAFAGSTVLETVAAVLEREPDWGPSGAGTPPEVRELVAGCLAKDAARRVREASELHRRIEAILRSGSHTSGPARPAEPAEEKPPATAGWLGSVRGIFSRRPGRDRTAPERGRAAPARIQPRLSQATFQEGLQEFPSWSPDGRELVYTAEVGGLRKIFRKRLDGDERVQLTHGDHDDIQPAWSPDGRTIYFARNQKAGARLEPGDVFGQYDGADIWSLDLETGTTTKLVENALNPALSPDGKRMAFDASWAGPRRIWVAEASGRNPLQVTSDTSEAVVHVRPRWSAGGSALVFQNIERTNFDIRLVHLGTGKLTWVTRDLIADVNPCWSPSGRFIYFTSLYRSGGLNIWRIALSESQDPQGSPEQVTTGPGQDVELAISPDGKKLAFSVKRQHADIWKLPVSPEMGLATGPPEKVIATTREDSRGAWSPDGARIAFNSDRSGQMHLWLQKLAGGSARQLTHGAGGDYQPSWSPDGRSLAFFSSRSGNPGIWRLDLDSGEPVDLTRKPCIEVNPFFSPDGRRIAYQSDRSGRLEVWVMDARGGSERQLTNVGVSGHFLRWDPDGGHVLFRCPRGGAPGVYRVPVEGGEPERYPDVVGGAHISLSPDGSRMMDVLGHKTLWVSPLRGGQPEKVFEFDDPDVRIDYPVWSPDGRWILFDRFRPHGADIWVMEDFE